MSYIFLTSLLKYIYLYEIIKEFMTNNTDFEKNFSQLNEAQKQVVEEIY